MTGEEVQEVTDGQSGLRRVPQRCVEDDGVLVAVADSLPVQIAGLAVTA